MEFPLKRKRPENKGNKSDQDYLSDSDAGDLCSSKIRRFSNTNQTSNRPIREATRRSRIVSENSDSGGEGDIHSYVREISSLQDLFNAFAIGYRSSVRNHLPSFAQRANLSTWTDYTINRKVRQSVFNLYQIILEKISTLVCGAVAAEASVSAVAKHIVEKSEGKNENKAVNAEKKKYQLTLIRLLSKGNKKTIQHRTLRAVLVSSGTREEVGRIVIENANFKLGHEAFTNGRKDLRLLHAGSLLSSSPRSLVRFDPSNVDIAIRNILSVRNVSFLSWGTIKIKHNGMMYEFPKVTRKVIKKDIYVNYRDHSGIARHRQLRRSRFFTLISLLTHSEAKVRTAVDYVTGLLVNDTFASLNRISAIFCNDLTERQTLEVELKVAETWLKYGISYHLGDSSNCAAHVIPNGLALPINGKSTIEHDENSDCSSNYSDYEDATLHESDDDVTDVQESEDDNAEMQERSGDIRENSTNGVTETGESCTGEKTMIDSFSAAENDVIRVCASCKHLCYLMDHLKKLVKKSKNNARDSALRALRNCQKKVKLFMGHKIRVKNQQLAIEKILEEMKKEVLETGFCSTCLITLDFKMKFDAKYYRELTLMFYGKRGMSWHGAMIQYYTLEVIDGEKHPLLHKVYMDHIVSNENKQDKGAVFAIVEAIIMDLKTIFPQLTNVMLVSDNAGCYQNSMLLLLVPYLSYAHGIRISRIIHTETQDGKSVLDAHFARAAQVIMAWVRAGNDCVTPAHIVSALTSSTLFNSTVNLIELDRPKLTELEKQFDGLNSKLKKLIKRINEVQIFYSRPPQTVDAFSKIPPFHLRAFAYSAQGDGVCITVSSEANCCKLTSKEVSETWSPNTSMVPLVVAAPVSVGENEIEKKVGKLTGIKVFGKSNLVMREKRWKRRASKVVPVKQTKKDMIAYALSKTQQLQEHGEIVFTKATDDNNILRPIVPKHYTTRPEFEVGWALRKGPGHMYGDKYTRNFRVDIEQQYQLGEISSNAKSSPAKILEYLQVKYPDELCLPSESDIRAEISRLIAAKKKKGTAVVKKTGTKEKQDKASTPVNNQQTPDSNAGTKKTQPDYLKFIIELAGLENPINPREAVKRVLERFPRKDCPHLPMDKQLSSSFTYQKRKASVHSISEKPTEEELIPVPATQSSAATNNQTSAMRKSSRLTTRLQELQ